MSSYANARALRQASYRQMAEIAVRNHVPTPSIKDEIKGPSAELLQLAGQEFSRRASRRADNFAARSSETCFDMASKLKRFGSYASEKQAQYAEKLVVWSGARELCIDVRDEPCQVPATPAELIVHVPESKPAPKPVEPEVSCPNICSKVHLNGFARFSVGKLTLSLKNDGSVIWVKWGTALIGRIDPVTHAFRRNGRQVIMQSHVDEAVQVLREVEADPLAAARENGVKTGRCSCCSRPLTDPHSIAFGIGPVCRERGWGIA